ncbi:snapalysin family zinc-dependent metalloprotease [Actinokineospora diospyrosa]|uniref:Extracellular small neutral protease n=1 Tax=Actinokineospora diospyrosa TaxID=103728 RepID=A0ABT1ID76_9PSEU|nr:snapalysin family zinc-dependent metalloprotease [Actinokineospora diospyrosa]MCP2270587.1 snapalysin [Actinokineospora diospyrosa]
MSIKSLFVGAIGVAVLAMPVVASTASAEATTSAVAAAKTVCVSTSGAPQFRQYIIAGLAKWNETVRNVQLKECSGATLRYVEGSYGQQGSHAVTNGHGQGTIYIDYQQMAKYDKVRITAHETGHALGLKDHYQGPCSELMSGGGAGTSCHNATPNSQERQSVERLWANGFTAPEVWSIQQ